MSNHYGNSGGGHYTAFGQNYLNKNWYDFDDNYCTQISASEVEEKVVTESAYSLFYRLRDHVEDVRNIDFDQIRQRVDESFLDAIHKHEEAKAAKKR